MERISFGSILLLYCSDYESHSMEFVEFYGLIIFSSVLRSAFIINLVTQTNENTMFLFVFFNFFSFERSLHVYDFYFGFCVFGEELTVAFVSIARPVCKTHSNGHGPKIKLAFDCIINL